MKKISVVCGFFVFAFILGEFSILAKISVLSVPPNIIVRFIDALITSICGIICAFFYSENRNTRPIIYFLYTFALAVLNAYVKVDNGSFSNEITYILFDMFSLLSVTCIILFTARSYSTSDYYKRHEVKINIVSYFPVVLFCIKHLLVVSVPGWTFESNPLKFLTHIIFVLVCITFLMMFFHLYAHISRESTMLLRFFTIGTCYTALPAAFISLIVFLRSGFSYTMGELCLIDLPLVYLPLILTASIFLYRSENTNYIVRMFIVFTGYTTVMVVNFFEHYIHLDSLHCIIFVALTLAIAPYFYLLVRHNINTFLTLETPKLKKDLQDYEQTLEEKENLRETFGYAVDQISNHLNYSYFFVCVKDQGQWHKIYSYPEYLKDEIIDQNMSELAEDGIRIRRHSELSNSGVVYHFFTDNQETTKIVLGPKKNGDKYLPSEISVGQRFLNPLFKKIIVENTKYVAEKLQKAARHSNLLDKEIQLAAFVQQSYYPKSIGAMDGWDIQFYCKPMAGVSGDLYDFYSRKNVLDGFGIYDVSGHGISSGLVTMLARNIIRQEFYKHQSKSLDEVMSIIDQRFRKEKNQIENFITGILVRIKGNELEMVNAAHPYPFVYRKNENRLISYKHIDGTIGSVIGLADFPSNFKKSIFTVEPGDEVILFTDGITEAMNSQHEQFGEERLREVIDKNTGIPLKEQLEKILQELNAFVGDAPASDDITIILLRKL